MHFLEQVVQRLVRGRKRYINSNTLHFNSDRAGTASVLAAWHKPRLENCLRVFLTLILLVPKSTSKCQWDGVRGLAGWWTESFNLNGLEN